MLSGQVRKNNKLLVCLWKNGYIGFYTQVENLENHEKPTWNHEKPWKPTWNHEKPWKPTKNHEKPWNYVTWPTRGPNRPFRCLDGGGERTKGGVVITNFWSTVFEQLRKEDHSDDSKWIEEIRGGAHQVAAPQLSNSFSFFNFHQKFPRCWNTIFSVFGFFPNWISRSTLYPCDWIED